MGCAGDHGGGDIRYIRRAKATAARRPTAATPDVMPSNTKRGAKRDHAIRCLRCSAAPAVAKNSEHSLTPT